MTIGSCNITINRQQQPDSLLVAPWHSTNCRWHSIVTARHTARSPETITPLPKTFTLLDVYSQCQSLSMFLKLTVKVYMMHVQCFACYQLALSPLATTSTTTKPAVQCYTQQYHRQKTMTRPTGIKIYYIYIYIVCVCIYILYNIYKTAWIAHK
jgi:hypothetical protein